MVLIKSRRPKVSRKRLLKGSITPFVSLKRLLSIQLAVSKEKCDGLLLVLGPDGLFNKGSSTLFNYLFFDTFSKDKHDMEQTKMDESIFEDLVMVIYPDKVSLYCNEVNYWMFLPYVAFWPNIQVYCLPEGKLEDSDEQEDFKVKSFLHMLEGCSTIGIFHEAYASATHFSKAAGDQLDVMMIEKWPLIQAHAFDDFGKGRGFFTLKYSVVDLSATVKTALNYYDGPRIENILEKTLITLENVYEMCLEMMDMAYDQKEPWMADKFSEPLMSYYKHGILDKSPCSKWRPFLLLGVQSVSENLSLIETGAELNSLKNLSDPHLPTHVIIQGVSPKDGIVCGRSYFLKPHDWTYLKSTSDGKYSLFEILTCAYTVMIDAVDCSINAALKGSSIEKVEEVAREKLRTSLSCKYSKYEVCVTSLADNLIVISVRLLDIRNDRGDLLGSLIYSDTYVLSILPRQLDETGKHSLALCLTDEISRWTIWFTTNINQMKESISQHQDSSLQLGDCALEKCDLMLPSLQMKQRIEPIPVYALFLSNKVCLFSRRIGFNLLHLKSSSYFDDSSDSSALLVMTIDAEKSIVEPYLNEERVCLLFHRKSQAKKTLFSKILPDWKKNKLPVREIQFNEMSVDALLQAMLFRMQGPLLPPQDSGFSTSGDAGVFTAITKRGGLENYMQRLQRRFDWRLSLEHLEMTTSWSCMRNKDEECSMRVATTKLYTKFSSNPINFSLLMPSLVEVLPEAEDSMDDQSSVFDNSVTTPLKITVVCGHAGSYKEQFCQKLMTHTRENIHWLFVNPLTSSNTSMDWQTSLMGPLLSLNEKAKKWFEATKESSHKELRVLLCLPNHVTLQHLLFVMANTLQWKKETVKLSSVTACVDTRAVFVDHEKMAYPETMELLREGWVNNIVFTDMSSDTKTVSMEKMQTLLQASNPSATTMHIPLGEVAQTSNIETILATETFWKTDYERMRLLWIPMAPDLHSLHFSTTNEIHLELKGHFEEEHLWKSLKDMKDSLSCFAASPMTLFAEGIVSFGPNESEFTEFWCNIVSGVLRHHRITNTSSQSDKNSVKWIKFLVHTSRGNADWKYEENENHCDKLIHNDLKNELQTHYKQWLLTHAAWTPPPIQPMKSISDLTVKEKEDLKKQAKLNKLPEGWFYNGSTYVHMDGRRSECHPTYEECIQLYLRRVNSRIQQDNDAIVNIKPVPLF